MQKYALPISIFEYTETKIMKKMQVVEVKLNFTEELYRLA